MSKAKLIFDLNNPDDKIEFLRATRATDMALLLWEYLRNSRKKIEQKLDSQEGEIDVFETVDLCFEEFNLLLEEYNLDIDELVD